MNTREKANQAEAILNNEVFKDCISSLTDSLISQWRTSESKEDREEYWLKWNALSAIVAELESAIHNFKIEDPERVNKR